MNNAPADPDSATPRAPQQIYTKPWMKYVLLLAAAYNVVWGAWVVLFPESLFHWINAEPPRYPEIWQCVGMIVGVYGIGYACAAMNPLKHWPIVLVGLLGKILGPIGFIDAALIRETLPAAFGFTILTNDLIWWLPFGVILWRSYQAHRETAAPSEGLQTAEVRNGIG